MRIVCFLIIVSMYFLIPVCFAQNVSSNDLILNADEYDGKIVLYEGELVGSLLKRGDYAWLNLHDGKNAIGVWVTRAMSDGVKKAGSHRMRGDFIAVSGIFHRSCLEHGGGLDIHAQKIEVIKEGHALTEPADPNKIIAISILLGVLACLLIIHIFQMKRRAL